MVGAHTPSHAAAVAWLEVSVHIKAVADPLRHSSISVTGDTYGHTLSRFEAPERDGAGTVKAW
jgi:integrase